MSTAGSSPHRLSRRKFLGLSGLIVCFASPIGAVLAEGSRKTADQHAGVANVPKDIAPDQVDGFLAIDRHGKVTVFSGKVDLGTGVRTAITQIAAEELDVPMERVDVIQGDTLLTPDRGPPTAACPSRMVERRSARRLRLPAALCSLERRNGCR